MMFRETRGSKGAAGKRTFFLDGRAGAVAGALGEAACFRGDRRGLAGGITRGLFPERAGGFA